MTTNLERVATERGWELRFGDCMDTETGLPSLADGSVVVVKYEAKP